MRAGLLGFVMVASLAISSATAVSELQTRPSFTGKWRTSDQRQGLSISQTASQISLTQTAGRLEQQLVYKLDGSVSENQTGTVSGEKWSHVSRARWVGAALLVTTTTTRGSTGRSWDWMTTYFLNTDGQLAVATLDGVAASDQAVAMELRTVLFNRQ